PIAPSASAKATGQARSAYRPLATAILAGIGINLLASLDWSQTPSYLILECFRRLLFLGLIFIGTILLTARSLKDQEADDRPAPWLLYAMLAALAVFFIHNLVDFSLAEPGPLMIFAVILGSVMGVRTNWTRSRWQTNRITITALTALSLLSLVGILAFPFPVAD